MTKSEALKMPERLSSHLELLFHPIRARILIEADHREVTAGQISEVMPDVAPASLYRHLRRLVAEGALAVVSERPVRGTVEKTYSATLLAQDMNLGMEEPNKHFFLHLFLCFLGILQQQFHLYMCQEKFAPKEDGLRFDVKSAYLTSAERQQLEDEMEALVKKAIANKPDAGRQPYLISRIFIPNKISLSPPQKKEDL